jgi:hypothetical protein
VQSLVNKYEEICAEVCPNMFTLCCAKLDESEDDNIAKILTKVELEERVTMTVVSNSFVAW